MKPEQPPPPGHASEEVAALIETLLETGHRLEELTAGEVDTVADRGGRTFLLRRAQARLRDSEAAKQAAILNALPAHIALLDTQGLIISVNEAWRRFAGPNVIQGPGYGVGLNYLEICDHARGDDSAQAHQAAEGIRSVLAGRAKSFSIEYSSYSPTEQRWFLLTVTPLGEDRPTGAIVMHLNITGQKRAKDELRESERRFSDLLSNVELISLMLDRAARITYCNEYLLRLTGWRRDEVIGRDWFELFVPSGLDERKDAFSALLADLPPASHHENEILTRSGERRLIRWNNSVLRSVSGEVIGTASIGEDVTERKRAEKALRESEAKYRHLTEQSADGIFLCDQQGNFVLVNSRGCELLGYCEAELLGMNGDIAYPEEERKLHARHVLDVAAGKTLRYERMVKRKDGSAFPAEISQKMLDNGMVQVITRDITDRRTQEQKISRLSRIHAVVSGINAAIIRIRDRRELFQEACRIIVEHGRFTLGWIAVLDHATGKLTAVAQAGLREDAGDGSDFFNGSAGLVPAGTAEVALREEHAAIDNFIEDAPGLMQAAHESDTFKVRRAAIELGAKSVIVLPLLVERETFGVLTLYAPEKNFFDDEEIKLLSGLAGDISFSLEFIAKEEKVDYLAYYDVLTGLANRRLFLERVAQYVRSAVSDGHKLALFLIDLERFKNTNDSLGQAAGDALLKQVAEWLTRNAGDVNLLARVGADHFAAVLPEVKGKGDVAGLLEKTMSAFLDHPFRLNDAVFRIAAKVGVALFPDDGTNADTLFRNAEAALKKAKSSGDRYLFHTQKMTETVAGKLTLENQLRQAIDKEEFVLHYQPQVDLASGKLTGAEALIRWNDPRTGLVPPGRFIPILEETGLIYEVGRWALRKAIEDHLRWRTAGLAAVRIAVNVSPLQLRHRDFIAEIRQAIGIDPHAAAGLELEITENLIMEDVKHSIASLEAIRAIGVSVAIDDFGTGFSSLSYLSKLPVDTLKIDRSFVIEMTAGREGLALVSTIINLAHALKLKVVAEGVETEEQARLLRLLNCDDMQGFLCSKPVPSEIFETRFLASPPAV
jgi:diguanylate cyclase (GGDEF)-like protein/PAS domain S-box-containing protein